MDIIVVSSQGVETLHCESWDLVEDVKNRTRFQGKNPNLILNGKILDDTKTLAECGISDGRELDLQGFLAGAGVSVAVTFNSLSTEKKIQFSPTAPDYRTVYRGINFKSTCRNKKCRAYKKVIYVPKRLGQFNIAKECRELKCPACGVRSQPSMNCGFYMAQWTFNGRRVVEENEDNEETDAEDNELEGCIKPVTRRADTEEYYTFMDGESTKWEFLEAVVEELSAKPSTS